MNSLKIVMLITLLLLLASCGFVNEEKPVNVIPDIPVAKEKSPFEGNFKEEFMGENVRGWILSDKETGCQYITITGSSAYTPRLNSHGIPMCKDTK